MTMLRDVFLISLTVSAAVLPILLLRRLLRRCCPSARLYLVWLLLAVRLLVPFRWEWRQPLVAIPPQAAEQVETVLSDRLAPAASPDAGGLTVAEGLTLLWAAGATGMLLRHLGAYVWFRCRIRPWLMVLEEGHRAGPLVLDPPVCRCALVEGPMLLGYFHPVIVLPETDYPPREREAVLLHERAHFRRKDTWYKLLLLLAKSVHWFNPLVWLMAKKAEEDLEYACDELVLRRQDPAFRRHYSRAILRTVKVEKE